MTRAVAIVAYPQVHGLELFGCAQVLTGANSQLERRGDPPAYAVDVLTAPRGDRVPSSIGVELAGAGRLADWGAPIDTLVVPGWPGAELDPDPGLVAQVAAAAGRARRVAALCTGAFVLAAAGLLDGRRATTHWRWGETLAARHPAVSVDTEPIYVRDGPIATSAGVTAGIDLTLALVEEDLGAEIARAVAGALVLFLHRSGNQSQFSAQLTAQLAQRTPIRELQGFIADHPEADLSPPALAARVHMSPRHFARVFRAEVGVSAGRYVERARVETARRRLEETRLPVEEVARQSGLGSAENLRRVFVAGLGVPPAEYRRRFGSRPVAER